MTATRVKVERERELELQPRARAGGAGVPEKGVRGPAWGGWEGGWMLGASAWS